MRAVVDEAHASVKKLNGIMPQSTNSGKFGSLLGKMRVKMNVSRLIMISGFARLQPTPNDMFR